MRDAPGWDDLDDLVYDDFVDDPLFPIDDGPTPDCTPNDRPPLETRR